MFSHLTIPFEPTLEIQPYKHPTGVFSDISLMGLQRRCQISGVQHDQPWVITHRAKETKFPFGWHFRAPPVSFCSPRAHAVFPALLLGHLVSLSLVLGISGSVIQSHARLPSDFKDQSLLLQAKGQQAQSCVFSRRCRSPVFPQFDACCSLPEMPPLLTCQSSVMYFFCPNMTPRDMLPF